MNPCRPARTPRDIIGGSPEQFNERVRAYLLHYAKLVQLAGVKEE